MRKVVIVDDQALVRAGLASILGSDPDLEVVGAAENGHDALDMVAVLLPDVVLMDIRMPHLDGLSATRRLLQNHPAVRIIVLTTFDLDEYVFEALKSGASAFLLKDQEPEAILTAVHAVCSGHTLVAPAITRHLIATWTFPRAGTGLDKLTPREMEVLRLVARGATNSEIGSQLVLEESTVKTHISRLLAKLNARDRVQLVITAYEAGLT